MTKVRLLPQEVIAKIAAGEVIERPSSVVKELVENSIDAGADSIDVRLIDGGKKLIEVRDTGCGIDQEDLTNVFQRHATSKISTSDDLFNIHSLGFRGEALYTVAAISDVNVKSKTDTQDSGFEVHVRGGEQQNLRPCALGNNGTHIRIKDLFFNTPARQKFLKGNSAEIHQILNTFIPYTLLYKDMRFKLTHQDRCLVDCAKAETISDRVAQILNFDRKHLIEVTQNYPEKKLSITLVLGDINIKRTRRDMQFYFVNQRPVFNKNMSYHMNQMYRLIMPPQDFPFFAVYITIPPDQIDVNVHPTKKEVKMRDEYAVCSVLRKLTEQTLMLKAQGKQVTDDVNQDSEINHAFKRSFRTEQTNNDWTPSSLFEAAKGSGEATNKDYAYPRSNQSNEFYIPENNIFEQQSDNIQKKLENARYIGCFIYKFLIFESGKSLVLMDQHAAAERITYEKLIRQMDRGEIEVQPLLSPVLVGVSPSEMVVFDEVKNEFKKVGLESTQFDDQTIAVHTQPVLLKDLEKTVRHLLAGDKITNADHDSLARRACRSSIMTGDKLNDQQAEYLREQLLQCLDPFTCPHGRPTVIEMSEDYLDKQFLRT